MKRILYYLYIGLVGILAFVFLLWITPNGSGVSPDSVVYLEVAKNLLSGKGDISGGIVVTHYPPLYSIFLAMSGYFISDLVQAARVLNALVFGVNTILIGLVVSFAVEHDFWASVLATLVFFFSAPLLTLHSMAWSEPLFLMFFLVSVFSLSAYIKKSAFTLMIISAVCLGLTLIARYIGIAFIPAALFVVFLKGTDRKISSRLWDTILFLLLVCTPLVIVFARNVLIAGSATNRNFIFHPVSILHVKAFINTLFVFLFPIIIPFWIKLVTITIISLFFVIGMVLILKQHQEGMGRYSQSIILTTISFLFFISYSICLFVSISFFDAHTPVDVRLLAPTFGLLIVSTWGIAWNLSRILKRTAIWRLLLFSFALAALIRMPFAVNTAITIQKYGQGYTSLRWKDSESIEFVKTLAADVKVFTNGTDAISFLSEKSSSWIPKKIFPSTLEANFQYQKEIEAMCEEIEAEKAMLVYFTTINWRWYLPTEKEIESTCQIAPSEQFEDGLLYGGW